MGRAMLIICAGLLVALGYTFLGFSSQREAMTNRNVSTYEAKKAKNTAHTGIQIAIKKYNDDPLKQDFSNEPASYDGANLTLSLNRVPTSSSDTIRVTSISTFRSAVDSVVTVFDITKKLQLVPDFAGALSKVGKQNVNFDKGNPKVHFDGHPPSGTSCPDKPGFTVNNQDEVDEYGGSSNIDGDPPVGIDNSIDYDNISTLIDQLADQATTIDDRFDWQTSTNQNPGVYFLENSAHYSGKDEGYGILVVRNSATLNIDDTELEVTGQFTFHGLVIFEDGSDFKGAGKAQFDGSVLSASDSITNTFDIKANGNFTAQYNCEAKKYADNAVNKALNTTIYKPLSVYE